jgi:hypothetical protein
MKFINDDDAKLFLIEVGRIEEAVSATKSYEPTEELVEELVKKRKSLIGSLKDHRKGQLAKSAWRANRHKMMRGIKAYHRSTEGKRFHRNLGTFLATRINHKNRKNETLSGSQLCETLKALSSARTHMYIECEYYHQVLEQAELEEFVFNYAAPMLKTIEEKVIDRVNLDEDELSFLLDITEEKAMIEVFFYDTDADIEEFQEWKNSLNLTEIATH